ncbi:MAG TPA: extracellular solute-binding protein [Candidatus Limnocylindrales bacterium]|jgi:multiple sugar transport system substrate-binding protein
MRNARLAVLVVVALMVAACGILPGGGNQAGTKLTIAAVQGGEDAGLKAVAPSYESKAGVDIEIVELPYADLYSKLVTTFQANEATYDLVMLDDPWMPKFGTDGSLQDLGQFGIARDPDIAGVIYDVGTWPPPRGAVPPGQESKTAQLLGVTIVGNVEMFMYRNDIQTTAPATWEDVLAAAQANDSDTLAGYVIRGKATNPVVADFLPILWSFGGDVFDENWNVVIDSDESMAAVNFLVNDLKAVAQDGPAETDAADRSRLVANGEGLQSTVWPGEVTDITNNQEVSPNRDKISYIPMPAGPSGKGFGMMGNWLLAIPKASTKGQAAAEFIKWMTQADTQKTYAEKGGIPSRTSILNDATLGAANPYFQALAESLAAGPNWRPRTDQWNAVETALGTHLNAALAGTEETDAAISAAADEIRGIMQAAGYPTQ